MKALLVLALVVVMVSAVFGAVLAAPLAVFPWLAARSGAVPVPVEAPGVPTRIGAPPGPVVGDVLAVARTWLGVPYLFGGCSSGGIDCSCLTELVYAALGVALPLTAQEQWSATSRVDQAALQPGDLVFFAHTYPSVDRITHVGIYIGGGMQINAPDTGQVVSIQPVFSGFWGEHFAGGGRPRR